MGSSRDWLRARAWKIVCNAVVMYNWPTGKKEPKPVLFEGGAECTWIVKPVLYWNKCEGTRGLWDESKRKWEWF